METELILTFIQTFFLIFYVLSGIARPFKKSNKIILNIFLILSLLALIVYFSYYNEKYFQWILFFFLVINYLGQIFKSTIPIWFNRINGSIIVVASICIFYYTVANNIVFTLILISLTLPFFLSRKWHLFLTAQRDYLFRVGTAFTVFFLLEPVFIDIQSNLKPIATIPISVILNQQNLLVLGGLFLLLFSGYFLNEKSKL